MKYIVTIFQQIGPVSYDGVDSVEFDTPKEARNYGQSNMVDGYSVRVEVRKPVKKSIFNRKGYIIQDREIDSFFIDRTAKINECC